MGQQWPAALYQQTGAHVVKATDPRRQFPGSRALRSSDHDLAWALSCPGSSRVKGKKGANAAGLGRDCSLAKEGVHGPTQNNTIAHVLFQRKQASSQSTSGHLIGTLVAFLLGSTSLNSVALQYFRKFGYMQEVF